MQTITYPFSAIVAQDAMKTALLLNAVDPGIGGVLIRGQKGTAKSTAARSLAALLPAIEVVEGCPYHCHPTDLDQMHDGCREQLAATGTLPTGSRTMPVIELPLSATEDRVVGSFQLEHALKTGQRHFEPGLLAAANRGILYVDEVNLLEDHLVDLLLDAAASGVNRVEREGVCVVHPARFMLIGTMNPEEGELRPQFLDRFGLVVSVEGLSDPQQRRLLIENRLAFEADPHAFWVGRREEEDFLATQIVQAQARLPQVKIPAAAYRLVVDLVIELQVHGHRADIALLKAARALAALLGKDRVGPAEIGEAAYFVLPHRLPGNALLSVGEAQRTLDEALAKVVAEKAPKIETGPEDELDELDFMLVDYEFPGSAAAGSMLFQTLKKKTSECVVTIDEQLCLAPLSPEQLGSARHSSGRRRGRVTSSRNGRHIRSLPLQRSSGGRLLDLSASLRVALLRGGPPIRFADLRQKQFQQQQRTLLVFLIDASESMGEGTLERMKAAKGAILGLLTGAYQNRDQVAMIAFRDRQAQVLLRPTSSVQLARQCLRSLPLGGSTPFASGLHQAWQLIRVERQKQPYLHPLLVIVSDGEANLPLMPGADVFAELCELAKRVARERIDSLVIDSCGGLGSSSLRQLASALEGRYRQIRDLHAGKLIEAVRAAEPV